MNEISQKGKEEKRVRMVIRALRAVRRNKSMCVEEMKVIFEAALVPTVIYGSETWVMNAYDKSHLEAVEMKYLGVMSGITINGMVRNEKI